MVRLVKLYQRIINNQKNIKFADLLTLIEAFGFELDRINGSHHIYKHSEISEALLSLQPTKDNQAKPYQIKQFLRLVEEYNLSMRTEKQDSTEESDEPKEFDS
jgi:predicted RNA binding protein YcfA (HicA-like mRNA interferase family)